MSRASSRLSRSVSDSSMTTGRSLEASCMTLARLAFRSRAVGCSTYRMRLQGVEPADAVKQRDPRRRRGQERAIEPFAPEAGAEIAREIAGQQVRAVGGVDIPAVDLSEGIVNGGIERARHDLRAQLRH